MVLVKISELRVRAILNVVMNLGKCLMDIIKAQPSSSRDGFDL